MKVIRKTILPLIIGTLWISISEFVRNEFLVRSFWIKHYHGLGLNFPSEPVNGAVWGIWSFMLALAIFIIVKKFNIVQTTLISWFMGFVMMWMVIGNLNVLPYGLLIYAVPLSILEAFIATLIVKKLS
jgi:hypothetical protein